QLPDHLVGHGVHHLDGIGYVVTPGMPVFVVFHGWSPEWLLRPERLRREAIADCQARSTSPARSAVTTRARPADTRRATWSRAWRAWPSSIRWPRWFTNKACPVRGLNHARRWRRTVPSGWSNSNQVPKGNVHRCW